MKIAYVKWTDSAIQRGQLEPRELLGISTMETFGGFVRETKEGVTLTRDLCDGEDLRDVIHIPWVNVVEYRVGRVGGLRRRKVRR